MNPYLKLIFFIFHIFRKMATYFSKTLRKSYTITLKQNYDLETDTKLR